MKRNQVYNDDFFDFRIGVTVTPIYRYSGEDKDRIAVYRLRHIVVGAGAGLYHIWKSKETGRPSYIPLNASLFGEYHFDDVWGVRAAFEGIATSANSDLPYTDYTIKTGEREAPVEKTGLWTVDRYYGIVSLSGMANMKNLLCGITYKHHFFLEAFLGPSLFIDLGSHAKISKDEEYMVDHELVCHEPSTKKIAVGAHAGLKLLYRLNRLVDFYFSPTCYVWKDESFQQGYSLRFNILQTFNLGVQFKL